MQIYRSFLGSSHIRRASLIIVSVIVLWPLVASAQDLTSFQQTAKNFIASTDQALATPSKWPSLGTRNLSAAAYTCLALNYHLPNYPSAAAEAEAYIDAMFTQQDLNSADATYGFFDSSYVGPNGQGAVWDGNAVAFCMEPLGIILKRYGNVLGAAYLQKIQSQTTLALSTIENRISAGAVSPAYSNIYLLDSESLVLCGEAYGLTEYANDGYSAVNAWIKDFQSEFVHEHDSPTYSTVTMDGLRAIANNSSNTVIADTCRSLLDVYGAELASYYFPGEGRMGGSRSRDYDFKTGHTVGGNIGVWYYIEGLGPYSVVPGLGSDPDILQYLSLLDQTDAYRTPADFLMYATSYWATRIVKTKWGPLTGQDSYEYLNPNFSIGSAGTYYDLEPVLDKNIVADLTSTTGTLGEMSLQFDKYDWPYAPGTLNPTGRHLPAYSATVQDHGTVLSVGNLGAALKPSWNPGATITSSGEFYMGPFSNISADILFPAVSSSTGTIYLDGQAIAPTGTYTATLNSAIGVYVGNAVMGARFFRLDGVGGYTPTFAVKFDDTTGVSGRMVGYLYQGATTSFSTSAPLSERSSAHRRAPAHPMPSLFSILYATRP